MGKRPRIEEKKVEMFVGSAHGDLDAVRQLLEGQPALVNAAWDWGDGDWETALGAAAHMGRKDIAEYLISRGARMDLFAAAMLGNTAIVKGILDAFPEVRNAPGPHGIPLLAHAKAGGSGSEEVVRLLEGEG